MNKAVLAVFVFAAAAVSSPASAQVAPTVGGALKFIEQLSAQGGMQFSYFNSRANGWNMGAVTGKDGLTSTFVYLGRSDVSNIQFQGDCYASYTFSGMSSSLGSSPVHKVQAWALDFSKLRSVDLVENEVHWTDTNSGGVFSKYAFTLPSREIAARLAYAMEFLRIECDALSSTGF